MAVEKLLSKLRLIIIRNARLVSPIFFILKDWIYFLSSQEEEENYKLIEYRERRMRSPREIRRNNGKNLMVDRRTRSSLRQYFLPSENVSAVKTAGSSRPFSIFPAAKTWWPSFPSKKKKRKKGGGLVRSFESLTRDAQKGRKRLFSSSHHFLSFSIRNCPSSFLTREAFFKYEGRG